ncbi:MAG: MotA/TolQ/ExbB proton channel family protein [Deltaproteobacteria bacterium]|nr:MotA/TolQ/ExbB proton channel family protein [Deltaproteobacteria bacterium]
MIPLLACSVVALGVTIERLIYWHRMSSKAVVEEMLRHVSSGEITAALRLGQDASLPAARILVAGLAHRNPSPAKAMEAAVQAEIPFFKKRLIILDTIITMAPLLGLLGTVTGMISSFGIMSEAGIGQPHAVTGGVAEALIVTATGLLIAIVALIPYNYFTARAEREMDAMEHYASRLELLLHGHEEAH